MSKETYLVFKSLMTEEAEDLLQNVQDLAEFIADDMDSVGAEYLERLEDVKSMMSKLNVEIPATISDSTLGQD